MKTYQYKNTTLAYEMLGEGKTIVFLHGWGVDHHIMSGCMEPIFEQQAGFKRIYIDLPGMGESVAGKEIRNSDDMLEIIYSLLAEESCEKKIILMGESYGGYLARGFMNQHPEMVCGLILLCPLVYPGYRSGIVEPLNVKVKDEAFLATLSDEDRTSFEYMNVVLTKKVWEAYCRDIMPGISKGDQHFLDCVLDGACSFDVDEYEKVVEQPILIVVGNGDTEVGYKDQFELLQHYRNASYHVINSAGHNLQIEQPDIFSVIVSSWLGSL